MFSPVLAKFFSLLLQVTASLALSRPKPVFQDFLAGNSVGTPLAIAKLRPQSGHYV
jgi:hypothetical protein